MAACFEPPRSQALAPRHADLPAMPGRASAAPGFVCGEGLRAVLMRLHDAGPDAWRTDAEAGGLMRFCADRYARLARKFDQEPADAAAAAFEVMRNPSTMAAADPWAVVTVAVRITLIAQHRADGLLTSTNRARRAEYSAFHDAQRFCDRETGLVEYHPALQTTDDDDEPYGSLWVVDQIATVLVSLGWPHRSTAAMVGHVCGRLADIGDRHAAYEALRHDQAIRVRFDISHDCWITLLRLCLGHPSRRGRLRHGLLARLLAVDTVTDLLADTAVVRAATRPRGGEQVG